MRARNLVILASLAALGGYALALLVQHPPVESPPPASPPPESLRPPPHHPEPRIAWALRRVEAGLLRVRHTLETWWLQAEGWRTFDHVVPEEVAYRAHDFLREVEAALARHWFAPDARAEYDRALLAWRRTQALRGRLREDPAFRAAEHMLANLAHEPALAGRFFVAHSDAPYLHVFASQAPLSVWDLPPEGRTEEARAEVERRRTFALRVLRRNAAVHRTVHDEMKRRYGTALGLGDLGAPYGGRPDLPTGVRSFSDGVTLVSLTLADEATARRDAGPYGDALPWDGFQADSGRVAALPLVQDDAVVAGWASWYGRQAAAQLLYWYTRQRNRWGSPRPELGFVDMGLAAWLGGVQLDPAGRVTWTGISGPRLRDMQAAQRGLREQGTEYRIFPGRTLVGFTSTWEAGAWAVVSWGLAPRVARAAYHEQSWALAQFLGRPDGPYTDAFGRFLGMVLSRETGPGLTQRAFAQAFRLQGEEAWRALDEAFGVHVREHLLTMDAEPYLREPPPLSTWDR